MCGILFQTYTTLSKVQDFIYGFEELKRRGPDNGRLVILSNMIFGFRRLSIVDPSSSGDQPMRDGDIYLIVNGEIYNHSQLREEFGLECHSGSDCKVIIKLYKKIGFKKMIDRLDGVFALVLIDGDNIYFARDRIGVRPLFIGLTEDNDFVLGSTAKSISRLCQVGGIKPLTPCLGEYNVKSKSMKITNYTYPVARIISIPAIEAATSIRFLLTRAVEKRLMSDRPICCLLSGGLDSSLIVSILCKLLGPENVRTFSIGMEGGIDLKYADKVAKYLGTQHTAVTFTETEAMAVIPEVIETIESHCITTIRASIANYLISKHISRETNNIVVFTGEGSDELFQGYLYFHNQPTPEEGSEESLRLMKELYIYDVLRCDRCVSENGLEPRVPFLDRHLVDYVLSLPPGLRCPRGGMEKYLLRKAFEHGYLPDEVLWRRKDGFSDACSSLTRPLRVCIAEYVETRVPDIEFDRIKSEYLSKEEYWYRKIFNILFPKYRPGMKSWMPKWSPGLTDPSGRLISAFDETEDDEDDEVEEVKSS